MADIELVIRIPEGAYNLLKTSGVDWLGAEHILDAVSKGTPLPKGHGDLKDVDKIRIVRASDSMIEPNVEIPLQAVREYINQLPTIIEADAGSNAITAGVEE